MKNREIIYTFFYKNDETENVATKTINKNEKGTILKLILMFC